MKRMKNEVCVYCRVANGGEDELKGQALRLLRGYGLEKPLNCVPAFFDTAPAMSHELLPGLSGILAAARRNKIKTLLVSKPSCFSHNPWSCIAILDMLTEAGVKVQFLEGEDVSIEFYRRLRRCSHGG